MEFYKKIISYSFLLSCIFISVNSLLINFSQAGPLDSEARENIENQEILFSQAAGFNPNVNVGDIMALFIKGFLSVLGIIFVVLIITAGYKWMTAGGNEERVTEAKEMIKRAIIGLIIIVAAYAISYFVFKALSGTGTGGTSYPP